MDNRGYKMNPSAPPPAYNQQVPYYNNLSAAPQMVQPPVAMNYDPRINPSNSIYMSPAPAQTNVAVSSNQSAGCFCCCCYCPFWVCCLIILAIIVLSYIGAAHDRIRIDEKIVEVWNTTDMGGEVLITAGGDVVSR